ncbi:hypothetical protein V6N13_089417 [Hibiscus sabdariffa]|uniref:1,3-beta-glucan synthase component FKS1-like domain-containing protein n=1 Tax=Hibiscus sabdariffa TaxID=183260 RepID=A0ABR2NSR6_9ROSI
MHARNDPREIQMYYKQFYLKNVADGQYTKKREEMAKICQIASVLYDVLRTVVPVDRVDDETRRFAKEVEKMKEQFEHYNILRLYAVGVKPAIMELPEIKAALRAIHVEGLPVPRVHNTFNVPDDIPQERGKPVNDVLDWLSSHFGFQVPIGCNRQQLELIYISLYLLIWGEASNIRFMPECLCYIFHNMANEVYGILSNIALQFL